MTDFIQRMANINTLSFQMIDKLTDYQLKRMKGYTDMMLKRVNDFSDVNDPITMRNYIFQQNEFIRDMLSSVNGDNRELAEIINEYSDKIRTGMFGDKDKKDD